MQTNTGGYLAKARASTAIRLPRPCEANFSNVSIWTHNWDEFDEAGAVHRGLFFDVLLRAGSVDEAMETAAKFLDGFASSLAYANRAAVGNVEMLIAYDYNDGTHDRAVLQRLPMPPPSAGMRPHDQEAHHQVLSALLTAGGDRDRIERAMAWYRKALASEYSLDRFTASWVGLAAIDPVLTRKHNIAKEQAIRVCEKCGHQVVTFPGVEGARRAVTATGGADLWKQVNEVRNDLLHARAVISRVVPRADSLQDPMARALLGGVADALGLGTLPERTPISLPRSAPAEIRFVLVAASREQLPMGPVYPHLQLAHRVTERTTTAGQIKETVEQTFTLANCHGSWGQLNWTTRLFHDPDLSARLDEGESQIIRTPKGDESADKGPLALAIHPSDVAVEFWGVTLGRALVVAFLVVVTWAGFGHDAPLDYALLAGAALLSANVLWRLVRWWTTRG